MTTTSTIKLNDIVHHAFRKEANYRVVELLQGDRVILDRVRKAKDYPSAGQKRKLATTDNLTVVANVAPSGAPVVRKQFVSSVETVANLSPEVKAKLVEVAKRFSPEWLTCDGELTGRQVARRRSELNFEWKLVCKLNGVSGVTPSMVYEV